MPISALVLTTTEEPSEGLLTRLRAVAGVDVGEPQGRKLPVVTDTESLASARDLAERLGREPGVALVDVVMVDFQDAEL